MLARKLVCCALMVIPFHVVAEERCIEYENSFLDALRTSPLAEVSQPLGYRAEIDDVARQRAILQGQSREFPISVSSYSDITEQFADGSNADQTAGVSLDVDLSFWSLNSKRNLIDAQITRLDLSQKLIEQQRLKVLYENFLSLFVAERLLDLFDAREPLLQKQLKFLEIEQANGVNRLAEITETRIKLSELVNKRLGAQAVFKRALLKMEIQQSEVPSFEFYLSSHAQHEIVACTSPSLQLVAAKADLVIKQAEAALRKSQEGPKLTTSLSSVTADEGKPQSAVGIRLSLPIYDGGVTTTLEKRLQREVRLAQDNLDQVQFDIIQAVAERRTLDELTRQSIELTQQRIAQSDQVIAELEERRQLGQSAFSDSLARKIDKSLQEEALLRLQQDFYQAIIGYTALIGKL